MALAYSKVRKDLQTKYRWELTIPNEGVTEDFPSEMVASVAFPLPGFDITQVHRGTGNIDLAGFLSVGSISVEFLETTSHIMLRAMEKWKRKVRNENHTMNYPSEYKRTVRVILFDTLHEPNLEFKLLGAWPSGDTSIDLNYAADENLTFTQDLTFDNYEIV